jgi:hypothetical protein
MSTRQFKAALLVASAFLTAPQIFGADKYRTYTPPPPRPAPPPPPRYNPSNNNARSSGQRPQASNNNSVRPTPRVTVTPRSPQPGRTPANVTRTPVNGNIRAQQNANDNRRQQVASSNLRQRQQLQLQQKQMFLEKQQQQQKLSAQREADAKARLAKLRASASNGNSNYSARTGTSAARVADPNGGIKGKDGGGPGGGGSLQDQFKKAAEGDGTKAQPVNRSRSGASDKDKANTLPGPKFNPK